ncbi:MAG TPA: N-succinylarginine dihydrolase, partial [Pirellulales bacterium]|nr:N-succinylarginine dihydrolase [Pirellulales bacterium]
LPASARFGDEGAANHTRLAMDYGQRGLEMFVYGRGGGELPRQSIALSGVVSASIVASAAGVAPVANNLNTTSSAPIIIAAAVPPWRFPARQTLEASKAIARLHRLDSDAVLFVEQNPAAIDAGVFHADVIAVGNLDVLLYHELAFTQEADADRLSEQFERRCGGALRTVAVSTAQVPLEDAVSSYLFNSQLLRLPDGTTTLLAPVECMENDRVRRFIESSFGPGSPIESVRYIDVRQSMNNGGGPACLRLRVVLTDAELAAMHQAVLLDEALYQRLVSWVQRHYRPQLSPADLADPRLLDEGRAALDELAKILRLGSIFDFQKA